MKNFLIISMVIYIIYAMTQFYSILNLIKTKNYIELRKRRARHSGTVGLFALVCTMAYPRKLWIDEFKVFSEKINVDLYDLHYFVYCKQIKDRKKLIANFVIYRDSDFDLDRVKTMNTAKVYNDIAENIEIYNQLRNLYNQSNINSHSNIVKGVDV